MLISLKSKKVVILEGAAKLNSGIHLRLSPWLLTQLDSRAARDNDGEIISN